jgi:hypothetical protein
MKYSRWRESRALALLSKAEFTQRIGISNSRLHSGILGLFFHALVFILGLSQAEWV